MQNLKLAKIVKNSSRTNKLADKSETRFKINNTVLMKSVAKCKPQETLGNFPVMLSARSVETRVLAIVRLVKVTSLVSLEIKRFV